MSSSKKEHPTIALFIHETFATYYQFSIISGIFDATQHYGISLVVVNGSEYNTPREFNRYANLIYQWVDKDNVDGIILVSAVFNFVDEEFQRNICQALEPLPVRVLGKIAGDSPNIVIDNASGLRDVIRHLIEKHGYRRLAFVNGPLQNKDAEERYSVYKEVLAEYNIPFDPDLVVQGGFLYADGQLTVRTLWDERKVKVEAIISANDDMALGILDALRGRGIKVPEQVALTGFDDTDGASTAMPPLTTVRQPVYQQAYQCVELLVAQIKGENTPASVISSTQPVYRRSCGCLSLATQKTMTVIDTPTKLDISSLQELFFEKRQDVLLALRDATVWLDKSIAQKSDAFMQALITDLQPEDSEEPGQTFLQTLEEALWETSVTFEHSMDWHSMISSMRQQLLPILKQHPIVLLKAETLWQTSHVFISEHLNHRLAVNPVRQEMENNSFRWITQDLITTFEQKTLMDVLENALSRLDIRECYIGIYENSKNSAGTARLVLGYKAAKRIQLEPDEQLFESPKALVHSLLSAKEHHTLVMESLHFRNECFGFAIFGLEDSAQRVNLNQGLRESISGGLKGARLAREVKQHSAELEDAYQTLRENQQQLMLAEKMASLGRLTAGIAHEMNTPLAAVRASLIRANKLAQEYKASIGDATVTTQDHHEIADEIRASVELAEKAAERAVGFVRSIKTQTRALGSQEHQSINAFAAVEDALLLLAHALRFGNCTVEFKSSNNNMPLDGVPGRLEQVVTNLVNNAIDASAPNGGTISIHLNQAGGYIELQVSDQGSGIAPENLSKIYDPLFTTKPFGSSTGLGLTIVHDIVIGEFGGSIDVASQLGQGSTFTIRLPVAG